MKDVSTRPATVDEYVAGFPRPVRVVLERVRAAIRKGVPAADEVISYGIAAYKLRGRIVVYFAGWKEHYAIYPATAALSAAFKKELAPYELSGKGTIRFPLSEPVPARLIAALAKFRAKEVETRVGKQAAAKKRTARKGAPKRRAATKRSR